MCRLLHLDVGEVGLHPLVSFGSFIDYADHTCALQCLGGYGDLQSEESGEEERNKNWRGFASSKGEIHTVVCCFCEAGLGGFVEFSLCLEKG